MTRKRKGQGPPSAPASAEKFALAGWGNSLTEVGIEDYGQDKSRYSRMRSRRPIPPEELEALYTQSALARRIVDRPADDGVREGFHFLDLPTNVVSNLEQIESALEDLEVLATLAEGAKTARLYGGALVVLLTDDGPATAPLQPESVSEITGFEIVASPDAVPVAGNATGSRAWTHPDGYRIFNQQLVHTSRVIRFDGVPVPRRMLETTKGWGLSELNASYVDLRRLGMVRAYMESLAHNVSVSVMRIGGLGKALLGGPENKAKAKAAVLELQRQVDNLHWLAIDRDDSFDVSSRPMQGLKEVEERAVEAVVMSTDIPREILTGTSPGGLNTGTNEGPIRTYYDSVRWAQRNRLTPALNRILAPMFAALGMIVPTWSIEWNPLWARSDQELAATRKTNADADAIYIDRGVATAQEIRAQRIADGTIVV